MLSQVKAKLKQLNEKIDEEAIVDSILQEELPDDAFSIYWRETMRVLIRRKFGNNALSASELARDWSVIDHIDPDAVLLRVCSTHTHTRTSILIASILITSTLMPSY